MNKRKAGVAVTVVAVFVTRACLHDGSLTFNKREDNQLSSGRLRLFIIEKRNLDNVGSYTKEFQVNQILHAFPSSFYE